MEHESYSLSSSTPSQIKPQFYATKSTAAQSTANDVWTSPATDQCPMVSGPDQMSVVTSNKENVSNVSDVQYWQSPVSYHQLDASNSINYYSSDNTKYLPSEDSLVSDLSETLKSDAEWQCSQQQVFFLPDQENSFTFL